MIEIRRKNVPEVALIGVSGFANVHYRDLMRLHQTGVLRFSAATVINQDEEAEKCREMRGIGTELFADCREMFNRMKGQIELCFIPTGIALHCPMCIDALNAGMNVLIEKPAAGTLAEISEMKKVSDQTGRFVAVGFQDIYRPEYQELKRMLLDGVIGRIKSVSCRAVMPCTNAYFERNKWVGKLKIGNTWVFDSPFNNSNAHQINLSLFLCGREFAASADITACDAEFYRAYDIESCDTGTIRAELDSGASLFIAMSRASNQRMPAEIIMNGENGRAILHAWDDITIETKDGGRRITINNELEKVRDNMIFPLLSKCMGANDFHCSLEIAAAHTKCINLAHAASDVVTVSERYRKIIPNPKVSGDFFNIIDGINDCIESAVERRLHLSEIAPDVFRPIKNNLKI